MAYMLAEEVTSSDERRFVSLTKCRMTCKAMLPEVKGKRCLESLGWFVTILKDGMMNLLHPLSWVEIGLPHICTVKYYNEDRMKTNFIFIRKAVLSSSPSGSTKDGNYVVMVIYGVLGRLGFWRPGDKTCTTIEHPHTFDFEDLTYYKDQFYGTLDFEDITYYKDQFYGVDSWGDVFACDIGVHNQTPAQARAVGGIPRVFLYSKRPYLVELDGDLLIVVRDRLIDDPETYMYEPCSVDETIEESKIGYGVKEFQVFKVDLCNEMEWAKIKSLGDYALFVGDNASISLQASKFPRIKANCIYYTDDCWRSYIHCKRGGGQDMGIYNLEAGSRTTFYRGESFSTICPPIWVNPSF